MIPDEVDRTEKYKGSLRESKMPKKSKWENVEFSYAGFYSDYRPHFLLDVITTVEQAAYQAMMQKSPETLKAAVKTIEFPSQSLTTGSFGGTLSWTYHIGEGLVRLAEMLWYRHAPTANCIEAYAKEKNLPEDEIVDELCRYRAQLLKLHFIHAWRLLDRQISEKIDEALDSLAEEVLAQTFCELGSQEFPLDRGQLYKLAVSTEELQKKKRMNAGPGGSESPYNLRWFAQYYAQAYRELSDGAEIYKQAQAAKNKEDRAGWKERIKKEHPDLDEELIARLSGNPRDLKEEHLALLAEKGGNSTPSDIALEQAARRCGIQPYLYTKRGLLKRIDGKGKPYSKSISSGIHTFLFNWYRNGRRLTEDQIGQIFSIFKHLPNPRAPRHLRGESKTRKSLPLEE